MVTITLKYLGMQDSTQQGPKPEASILLTINNLQTKFKGDFLSERYSI